MVARNLARCQCRSRFETMHQVQSIQKVRLFSSASVSEGNAAVETEFDRPTQDQKQEINVLRLNIPVLQQLYLEEALLRSDDRNWCIVNTAPSYASSVIVLGISGKEEKLVNLNNAKEAGLTLIRRFSGGGTVYVDQRVNMVSLIVNEGAVPRLQSWPRPIMRWTEAFYKDVFPADSKFHLNDHDYCFGDKKFGGNAQSLWKKRWLHHTSFLYDIDYEKMEQFLQLPEKRPEYRENRSHSDFLVPMKEVFPQRVDFDDAVVRSLGEWFRPVLTTTQADAEEVLTRPHMRRTVLVSNN